MKNEKTVGFTITKKSNNAPDSYFLNMAYQGYGLFSIASRNANFVTIIIPAIFLLGLFIGFIGLVLFLAGDYKHNPLLHAYFGASLVALSGIFFAYVRKIESKIAPHVFDWLVSYLEEESVYFSTESEFNDAVESFDTGFSFHGDVIHRKIGDGKYISKLPTGIFVQTGIVSNVDFSIYMSALTKSKVILALRERKDLLLEFFPDDVKINASLNTAGE